MHLTWRKETAKPAGLNFLQQQARFDDFIEIFNNERPPEALDTNCPAEVYQPSTRPREDCRMSIIPSTINSSSSPVAAASVSPARKLISARSLLVRRWASTKFTTLSGWSTLWIMIWNTSICILGCSNRWKIPSAQKCYPCVRYDLSPMCPGRTQKMLVGSPGFEPGTNGLIAREWYTTARKFPAD
jgi:hypothetical protein